MQFFKKNIFIGNFFITVFLISAFSAAAQQNNDEVFRKALHFADSVYAIQDYEGAKAAYQYAARFQNTTHIQQRLATIDGKIAETDALNKKYNLAVSEARQALNASDLPKAKERLEYALTLKPNEKWATEKLTEINKTLTEQAELQRQFDELIGKGDRFFTSKNYAAAKTEYETALKLMPTSVLAKEKISATKTKIQEIETEYKKQIASADALYRQNELTEAKTAYQAALQLKPDQPYPKQKIEQIDNIIYEEAALTAELETVVQAADQAFDNKNYTLATKKYNEALDILSSHAHSKERLQEIRRLIGENEAKQLAYNGLIEKANAHFDGKRYVEAKNEYQNALNVLPNESFPKERIAAINGILNEQNTLQQNYDALIVAADAAFNAKNWETAVRKYTEAIELKPSETYPKQQLAKANKEVQAQADINKRYGESIATADNLFNSQKWNESITAYQAAAKIKPTETYPAEQIAIAKTKMGDLAQLENNYKTAISEGDVLFKAKSWNEAIAKYREALTLKPAEVYPQQQIDKANAELGAIAEVNASYTAAIETADALFAQAKWTEAIVAYQSALKIKPAETYPKQQIEQANAEIKAQADREKELEKIAAIRKSYDDLIAKGDALFHKEDWQAAKTTFQQAATLLPEETYPPQKIAAIDKILEDIVLNAEQAAENTRLYREKVAEANGFISDKNYQAAVNTLKSALNYKPNDDYATKKIAELQKILDDIAFAKSEYARLIAEGDVAFAAEKYRDAIAAYRAAMRHQPDEMYPRKKISDAERNLEYTPEKRRQLAQESLQRGEDAVKVNSFEAAMRAFGNAYYWYPENGESTRNKIKSIISTLEAGSEKNLLEQPLDLTSNRRGTIELEVKPSEIKGTAYILFKISGSYENNVNVFLRWGRFGNESGSTVVTLVYGLDDIYYCAEIKGVANGLTWIAFIPENTDVTIEEAKLMSR